ncbi:FYVE, RhoGEF and PH domain-containing protein 6-like isoform X2 [Macrosteles quadrilineatus]|uniref:FYVE, RhoGEF and PH domain-containing protein 6-like isoform X2 n=1 Tax=Macrosteles quadrilineatus TaxID=74068 RepID=UPI0023E2DD15|nr:FYVE, RhoGEF and PH domain-containing protein 6-like isoform X2 [Macrosteles quadrilineatus]
MESPSTTKPTPPPKPSPLKTKEFVAQRFSNEILGVPRQKPPLAPKPVLPAKPGFHGAQPRVQRRHVVTQVGVRSESEESERVLLSSTSRLVTVETKHVECVISSDDQHEESVITHNRSVVTSVETAACEADKIIKDTWASLQEQAAKPPSTLLKQTHQNNTSDVILRKCIQTGSPLFSSDLTNELNKVLPSRVKDGVTLTRSNSEVTNTRGNPSRETINAQRPSLQVNPPTPESGTEGDWVLVNNTNESETKLLPSSKSISDSSPPSNSSFLYPSGNPNLNSSSESSKSGCDFSNRLVLSSSDCDVTLRNKRHSEHSRGASWSEENDSARSRTNSIGNESFDGTNNSVRRRISSFFGSFGKGGKTKEKRESSLFYYSPGDDSQMESSDSGRNSMTSLSESSNLTLNNNNNFESPDDSKQNLNVSNECCDRRSNRSSISDENFDGEQSTKSDNISNENNEEDIQRRRKDKCYMIVHELMTSEKVYIDVLKLLCQDFKEAVESASPHPKSPVIPSSDLDKIINNLPQLLIFNENLLKDIESRIETWSQLPKVADVFVTKGPFLKLYLSYYQNFVAQTEFLQECCEKYCKFAQVVKDFEKSDRCKKLALSHYMLKPIQRLPQYKLLLERYLEHQEADAPDFIDTQKALKIVCDVADHANSSVNKDGDPKASKLLSIQSQLGDYEIVKPGRHFVKEGELYKLCRKDMQHRFFILLSDCLLYTSYYGSMTGLKVKNKLPLAGMKVTRANSTDCSTEFSIITSTRSFTLRAKNEEECSAWVEALQMSIKDYNTRQMTFKKVDPMTSSNESLKIGREAPVWIQDKRVTMCQICTAEFTITFRRHHCRACGKVVCSVCSDYNAPMQYLHFNSDRVCVECYKYLMIEMDNPAANMAEVVKKELRLTDEEVPEKVQEIKCLFKKIGHKTSTGKKRNIPQRLKEVPAFDSESQMNGWLLRKSRTSWKRLWFVLKEQVLYAYRASEDVVASHSIPVLGYKLEKMPDSEYEGANADSKVLFKLVHPGQPPLVFATDSNSADRWIAALQEATTLKLG